MLVLSKKQKKAIGHDYMTEVVRHRYDNPQVQLRNKNVTLHLLWES